ncbi:MAG: hypothetical protein JWP28_2761 [Phenylobacterium sp.]|uniref:hypothetical protein n=1 Tax=Phenylobacterium sp. TaxID=1871053 RepID=UPI00262803EA|nr:hypothetical protein [Phenylobacterium sp.]MDB5443592.1 hypothetical protein [Phenylobacterium sp.]MDB5498730.1 hypothetical protein [Phenylobacterium sp.]
MLAALSWLYLSGAAIFLVCWCYVAWPMRGRELFLIGVLAVISTAVWPIALVLVAASLIADILGRWA